MKKIIFLFIALFIFSGCTLFQEEPITTDGVACTMDAKICPDGTAVGRIAPDCEFEACPDMPSTATWSTSEQDEDEMVFCTQDVKECPDGSYVGRHGPDCAFDACPGE